VQGLGQDRDGQRSEAIGEGVRAGIGRRLGFSSVGCLYCHRKKNERPRFSWKIYRPVKKSNTET
jgi:hypothetical protein